MNGENTLARVWYLFALRDELPIGDRFWAAETHESDCYDDDGTLSCDRSTCTGTEVALWQYPGTDSGFGDAMDAARKALRAVLRDEEPASEPERAPLPRFRAVAYVAARWPHESENQSHDHYLKCMTALQDAVNALRHATQARTPTITIERVWPMYFRGAEYEDGSRHLLGPTLVEHTMASAPEPSEEQLKLAGAFLVAAPHNHPVEIYRDFRLSARNAARVDGDYVEAVLRAATACEILVKHVAWTLTWEATEKLQADPEPAAERDDLFVARPATLIGKVLSVRLHGSWESQQPKKPVGAWRIHVAQLRNRVIHRGYRPAEHEMADLLSAVEVFEKHILDRVAANAAVYPRTCWMLLGGDGLSRRGLPENAPLVEEQNDIGRWWNEFMAWLEPRLDVEPPDA